MPPLHTTNKLLANIKANIYDPYSLALTEYINEQEGTAYDACRFRLNEWDILGRTAKRTPKKVGQFVTCWKRNKAGITTPFADTDTIDFYVITVEYDGRLGQFIFPKSILIKKGIMSTSSKDGKRGFRVYPIWDTPNNNQARRTQKWQLDYFVEFGDKTNYKLLKAIFKLTT